MHGRETMKKTFLFSAVLPIGIVTISEPDVTWNFNDEMMGRILHGYLTSKSGFTVGIADASDRKMDLELDRLPPPANRCIEEEAWVA
jgi:hypothetical protein